MAMDEEEVVLPTTGTEVSSEPTEVTEEPKGYTIEDYLGGLVRNVDIDTSAMLSILVRAGVEAGSLLSDLSEREVKLCTAWTYVWLSTSPVQSRKVRDADGQWSHEEGGEVMSALVLKRFLDMANQIFKELGLECVGSNKWGFKGNGFRNIRSYGGRGRNLR